MRQGATLTDLAPGGHALIWGDDGGRAETCMDLSLRVRMSGREVRLSLEFLKLYCQRNLRIIEDWVSSAGRRSPRLERSRVANGAGRRKNKYVLGRMEKATSKSGL